MIGMAMYKVSYYVEVPDTIIDEEDVAEYVNDNLHDYERYIEKENGSGEWEELGIGVQFKG